MFRATAQGVVVVLAQWSETPEMRQWTSAPPSSSSVTSSPVAALTSGGPADEDRALVADDDGLVAHGGT